MSEKYRLCKYPWHVDQIIIELLESGRTRRFTNDPFKVSASLLINSISKARLLRKRFKDKMRKKCAKECPLAEVCQRTGKKLKSK